MQTIAIVNEKGGTGKTTTAVNLSAALGEMGRKVLLVDLDGQAASSRWLGVEEDSRLADAMLRGGGLEPLENVVPGVSLAPGSGKLDSVSHDLRPTQGGQLRRVLSHVNGGYDYTLIDCPPSLGNRLIGNALLAATHAIVPVEMSILALDGLKILLTTLEDVREGFEHEIALAGVLACRYDARTRLSRLVLAELKRALPGKVFQTVIRENVRIRECPASGQSILTYAPNSHAAEDYRSLARELLALPVQPARPLTAEQPETEAALSEEERAGIARLREQVDAMLRESAGKSGAPTVGATPASESRSGSTPGTAQAEDSTAPGPEQPPQPFARAPGAAEPSTPVEVPSPSESSQEHQRGQPAPQPPPQSEPAGESQPVSDAPPPEDDRADVDEPKQAGDEDTWEVRMPPARSSIFSEPSVQTTLGADEVDRDEPEDADADEPEDADSGEQEDETTPEEQPEDDQQHPYPALRELLREMVGQDQSDEADGDDRTRGAKDSPWRRILRKTVGM